MTFILSEKPLRFVPNTASYIFVKSKEDVLAGENNTIFFEAMDLELGEQHHCSLLYIGELKGKALYALEPSEKDTLTCRNKSYISSRKIMDLLNPHELTAFDRACYLLNWDKVSKFCGCCGKETHLSQDEFVKLCGGCGYQNFPQYSLAINFLVVKGPLLLLVRSPHFEPGMYSPGAGFMAHGETPFDTVHRELWEEVKIKVHNVQISKSVAGNWPRPNTLLLGFLADYKEGTLTPDPKEVEDAQWFHYTELPKLPPKSTISYKLVQEGIKRCQEFDKQNTRPGPPQYPHTLKNVSTGFTSALTSLKNWFSRSWFLNRSGLTMKKKVFSQQFSKINSCTTEITPSFSHAGSGSHRSHLKLGSFNSFGLLRPKAMGPEPKALGPKPLEQIFRVARVDITPQRSLSKSTSNPPTSPSLTWLARSWLARGRCKPFYIAGACLSLGMHACLTTSTGNQNRSAHQQRG